MLLFGLLSIGTTAASLFLLFHEQRLMYTEPLFYDFEKAWQLTGEFMVGLWTTYTSVWFIYFFIGGGAFFEVLWKILMFTSPLA